MIIKTSELEGAALDWSVAKVEGIKGLKPVRYKGDDGTVECWLEKDNLGLIGTYSPSRDWQCGGPLVEEYIVSLIDSEEGWKATNYIYAAVGLTPLIACCRAIVSAELGETVDVPEELVK